jgi:hypothetical protein
MKISVLKPIVLSLLASAVMTACSNGGGDNAEKTVEKTAAKSCIYNIQGGNTVDIMFGTVYTNPSVTVTQEGKSVAYEVKGSVDTSRLGKNEITYSSESCPNEQIRTVNVVASSCTYKLNGANPLEVLLGGTYNELGVEVKNINNKVVEYKTTGSVDTSKEGEYTLTYQGIGCKNSQKRVVKIKAKTTACNYELKGNNPLIIALNGEYTDLGVTAKTVKDNKNVKKITISGDEVDTKIAKDYEVTYQGEGCSNDIKRTISVKAPTKCTYNLAGDNPFKLIVGSDYIEPGFSIKDANDKIVTTGIAVDTIEKDKIGEYKVTYQDNSCTNSSTRIVKVVAANCTYSFAENTNPLTLLKGTAYTDIKPTVKSATGKYISKDAVTIKSNNVDTTTVKDNYEVVYEAAGCPNTATRYVNVELANCTYQFPNNKQTMDLIAGQKYVAPKVTIKDMPNVNVSVLSGEVKKEIPDTYTIIYGAEDVCANTANFIVNVKKITDKELKALKEEIGKTILPKI